MGFHRFDAGGGLRVVARLAQKGDFRVERDSSGARLCCGHCQFSSSYDSSSLTSAVRYFLSMLNRPGIRRFDLDLQDRRITMKQTYIAAMLRAGQPDDW